MNSMTSPTIIGKSEHGFDRSHGTPKVGFYGCNRGGGEVVRLMLSCQVPRGRRYPQILTIACPACGHEHSVKPFWRAFMARVDEDKRFVTVEYTLPE